MFFVAKEKIGTTLGNQKEYAACTRRGVGFTSHSLAARPGHSVWHYFWPADMIEPSIRSRFEQNRVQDEDNTLGDGSNGPTHYLWSQEVAAGEVIGEPVITPYTGAGDWIAEATQKFNEANPAT